MAEFLDELQSLLDGDKNIDAVFSVDDSPSDPKDIVSTGLLPLDVLLGGGIFRGRLYEVYGPESNGKSTLVDSICAAWHAHNPKALVYRVESESTMDKVRCSIIGMDLHRTILFETDILEEGFEQIKAFQDKIHSKYGKEVPVLIVWDTITAAAPKNEIEGDAYAAGRQEAPRLLTREIRKLNHVCAEYGHSVILIQQVRQGGADRYGNIIWTTNGGQAFRHFMSARLEVKKRAPIFDPHPANPANPEQIGNDVDITMRKNKITGADGTCVCRMYKLTGFDKLGSTSLYATSDNHCAPYITMAGAGWITVNDHRLNQYAKVQGAGKLEKLISEDPYLVKLIEYAAYKARANYHEIFATKYKTRLEDLEKELDAMLAAKNAKPEEVAEVSNEVQAQTEENN